MYDFQGMCEKQDNVTDSAANIVTVSVENAIRTRVLKPKCSNNFMSNIYDFVYFQIFLFCSYVFVYIKLCYYLGVFIFFQPFRFLATTLTWLWKEIAL